MIYNENGTRFKSYKEWESTKYTPYDYEKNGIIQHIASRGIATATNPILKTLLSYYDKSITFLLKYVDRLKNFKNYHWKNR